SERSLYPCRASQADAAVCPIVLPRHLKAPTRERRSAGQREELEDRFNAVALVAGNVERKSDLVALTLIRALPPPNDIGSRNGWGRRLGGGQARRASWPGRGRLIDRWTAFGW